MADVRRGFGQPTFAHEGARLEDVLGLFDAGESIGTVALEFGLTGLAVEDADAGWLLTTLVEHYGKPTDESVADVDWLALCGERRWPVL